MSLESWLQSDYLGRHQATVAEVQKLLGVVDRELSDSAVKGLSADGQFIYYVSECLGSPANIVRQDAAGKSKPEAITPHKDEAVRRARISGNGDWIVYECGPEIWVTATL